MRTHLHLVSMPMHEPLQPSAQLGYLHAHIARALGERVAVSSYSAHLDILFRWKAEEMRQTYYDHRLFGEELFLLACSHEDTELFERVFERYRHFGLPERHVTRNEVAELCASMRAFVEHRLLPALDKDTLHVIGFTTTFSQVFASVFAAREIARRATAPVVFVFGGASVTLPETREVLRLWGIDGLVVQGSGETPLEALLRLADTLPDLDAPDALAALDAAAITNVSRIGAEAPAIDLALSRDFMDAIGDPDYSEFFDGLRRLSDTDRVYARLLNLIAVPLEGSRGCFAKCDFCQNPFITTRFRSMDGTRVAERALRVGRQYGTEKIYFADSVCNSWAEAYADRLLAEDQSIDAFMELRVHAPQSFFTKLSLAGVSEVQLGVEAVSEPLLKAMNKGTTVWQNLRATKYLAELGIRSVSNLITHHPRSTPEDVTETRRVVAELEHLRPFSLSQFVVSYASPIFDALPAERREELPRGFGWLPADLRPGSTQRDLAYPYPAAWLPSGVKDAWDDFRAWHRVECARIGAEPPILNLQSAHGGVEVTDARDGGVLRYRIEGMEALVLDLAHHAPKAAEIARALGCSLMAVEDALAALEDRRLILRLGERVLSLPLRPRAWLVAEHEADTARAAARGGRDAARRP